MKGTDLLRAGVRCVRASLAATLVSVPRPLPVDAQLLCVSLRMCVCVCVFAYVCAGVCVCGCVLGVCIWVFFLCAPATYVQH